MPVLLDEVLAQLAIRPDGVYVDATFGRGGHSRAILARLGPDGRLLALDRDPDAVRAGEALAASDSRFAIMQSTFSRLGAVLTARGLLGSVHGLLLDLGVSSPQLDDPARGFGFRADGPLDMRMDPAAGPSAADWLNAAPEREIAAVLRRFGEEPAARRVARAICAARARQPLSRTLELAEIVSTVLRGEPGRHPATRTFQAIRIFINKELEELRAALEQALSALAPRGRICVISFHSLEDRIVKHFLRDHSRVDPRLADLPVVPAAAQPQLRLPAAAIRAGEPERARNPRSRSAVLRVAERLA